MEPTLLQEDYQGNKAAPFDFKNIPGFDLETYGREHIARMFRVNSPPFSGLKPELDEMLREEMAEVALDHGHVGAWISPPPPMVEGENYFIDPVNRSIVVKGPGEYIGMPRLCSKFGWLGDDLKPIPGVAAVVSFNGDLEIRWDAFGRRLD